MIADLPRPYIVAEIIHSLLPSVSGDALYDAERLETAFSEGLASFGIWDRQNDLTALWSMMGAIELLDTYYSLLSPHARDVFNHLYRAAISSNPFASASSYTADTWTIKDKGMEAAERLESYLYEQVRSPGKADVRAAGVVWTCRIIWVERTGQVVAPLTVSADSQRVSRGPFADFVEPIFGAFGLRTSVRSALRAARSLLPDGAENER